tara:strand:+ start:236 stop:511 length:276 start_codon:yes stop_codon:yes gene_type:complete
MAYCSRPITAAELAYAKVLTTAELETWDDQIQAKIQAVNEEYTVDQIYDAYESTVDDMRYDDYRRELQDLLVSIKQEHRQYRAAKEKMLKS